jgi:hypothetical protein
MHTKFFLTSPQGYLFCAEIMPRNHELQLMLINTLRKVHFVLSYVFPICPMILCATGS